MPTTTLLMREIPLWDAFCKKLKSHTEVRKVCSESQPKYVSPQRFNSCVLPCSSAVPGCVMGVSCVLLWQPHAVQGGVSFRCHSTKACHSSTAKLYMSHKYHTCGCSNLWSNWCAPWNYGTVELVYSGLSWNQYFRPLQTGGCFKQVVLSDLVPLLTSLRRSPTTSPSLLPKTACAFEYIRQSNHRLKFFSPNWIIRDT